MDLLTISDRQQQNSPISLTSSSISFEKTRHDNTSTKSWAQNKILQVQTNTHILKALFSEKEDLSKGAQEDDKEAVHDIVFNNYGINQEGTIEVVNQPLLKKQKKVLGFLLKEFGAAILKGKSIMNVSLPVSIFEPLSQIEREAHSLLYAPHFLEKAGEINDVFEQFKLTISYFIASLHLGVNPQKPFNPVLGETFQGSIGGYPVFGEQVSHHPPALALQMLGKNYTIQGTTEFNAHLSMNSVKSKKIGCLNVIYKNTGAIIKAQSPAGMMQGTAIGKRTFHFTDKYYIFDIENKFYAEIDFDCEGNSEYKRLAKEAKENKKPKIAKDFFSGAIWVVKDNFVEIMKESASKLQDIELKFKEKEHAVIKLETIQGHWMQYLKLGEQITWSFGDPWPYKLQYMENPLPSDSNFRLDLLYLKIGEEEKAQDNKKRIEEVQRHDRKLREKYASKSKK